jgi:single-stranded DNA-binding protein
MNTVSVIGRIVGPPELRKNRAGYDECRMRLAIPRRQRDGQPDAGVVYLDVATFGPEARECAQLHEGASIGLSGRLESDDPRDPVYPPWSGVLIDQLDVL